MKKLLRILFIPFLFIAICAVFFYPVILNRKLPVPDDTLIGLYHPWRDLYASTNPRGVPYKNFLITDPIRQQIPWRKLVVDSMKQGKLASWNPFSFSGTSLIGNIQAGALYPLNVLFLFLSFPVAWTGLIILQPVLGGLFLFAFLKRKHLQPIAALLGAISWSFSGFFIAWLTWGTIDQTALWLPFILVTVDTITECKERKTKIYWSAALALSLACTLFAGHAQVALYVFILAGLYGFIKKSWWLVAAAGIAVLISSGQWVPLLQTMSHSSRLTDTTSWLKDGWFLPWQNLVQFVAPDFFGNPATLNYWGVWNYGEFIGYIGILPIICALFAISVRKDRMTRFFAITLGIILLFLLPNPISRLPFQFHIPVLSTLQPTRLMVLVDFCLAILASLGADAFLRDKSRKIYYILAFIFCLFTGLWIYTYISPTADLLIARHNLIVPSALFIIIIALLIAVKFCKKKYVLPIATLGMILVIVDLFRFGWKFTPFTPPEYFFPQTQAITFLQAQPKPFRVMSLDNRLLPPNTASYYGIESVEGYDPVYDARYEEFIAALNRNKPDITPPFGFNRIVTVTDLKSPLLPLLNAQYVLSLNEVTGPGLELVYTEGQTKIYRYASALPRMYPVESVIYSDSKQHSMNVLYSTSFNPMKQAIVEDNISIKQKPVLTDHIDILTETASDIRAVSTFESDHFVVIANMYDAGWKASVDAVPTRIYRADYLFQGIIVPKGTHTVLLQFER